MVTWAEEEENNTKFQAGFNVNLECFVKKGKGKLNDLGNFWGIVFCINEVLMYFTCKMATTNTLSSNLIKM